MPTTSTWSPSARLPAQLLVLQPRPPRFGEKVTTIIGSVRADEISADYLQAVSELGDFGHLFTELHLTQARGIITIAPEWAASVLVTLYGKMHKRERANKALDLCRASDVNTVMPYFIIGAPTRP
ncbi:hypothetical protein CQW39_24780 [Streptomyces griseofuscus]|uniref:hypothetical protein n=1 Tax=Streptomyces griseofuscus TaxID=146922 RepID=UPI000F648DCC|nr:hypothetical protein [Streptomyces griseofuscus]RRQ76033.1 hypothetical protein CQW39_24780 [Streptomyces griseofuscus]